MKQLISYVLPVYNESGNIPVLYETLNNLLAKHKRYDYELVFINDGSHDDSLEKLISLQKIDKRVCVINLSRNFGHQMAITAGLDYASGDAVIVMDSDMQDPPRVSFELVKQWEKGFDVVYAQRRTRKDGAFKRASASAFYKIFRKLSDIDIPANTGDFRLLDRKVVIELRKLREHGRFMRGLVSYVGFSQTGVLFDRDKRRTGVTGYPLKVMWKLAFDGILSFSSVPLRLISRLGIFFSFVSFLGIAYALLAKLIEPAHVVPGWAFIVIAVFMIGGVQLIMLGVLGGYVGRIYSEIQNRPLYIVASVFASKPERKNQP